MLINAEYVNTSIYSLLSGNSCIELPRRLKNSVKGLVNIKNNDNKYFHWCHIRHLNLLKKHPERITIADIKMVNDVDYEGIEFPVSKKYYCKIEEKYIFASMCFVILFMYQIKNLKIVWIYY